MRKRLVVVFVTVLLISQSFNIKVSSVIGIFSEGVPILNERGFYALVRLHLFFPLLLKGLQSFSG